MKGRPKKPTVIKKAQGTLQSNRTNKNEPVFVIPPEIPKAPEYFDKKSKEIYYHTANELLAARVFYSISLPILITYSYNMAQCLLIQEHFSKTGIEAMVIKRLISDGSIKHETNPLHRVLKDCYDMAMKAAQEMGITPASSSKISIIEGKKKNDLDKLLDG